MRIHGRQIYLYSGSNFSGLVPIGCSTECVLDISVETIGLCKRAGVKRSRAGRKSWNVSARGFLAENGDILPMAKIVGQPLFIAISVLREDLLRSAVNLSTLDLDEEVTLVGCAIASSAKLLGTKGALVNREAQFVGDGELGLLIERGGFPYILPIIL